MSKSRWLAQTLLLNVCDAPKAQVRQIAGPGLSLRDIAGSKNLSQAGTPAASLSSSTR